MTDHGTKDNTPASVPAVPPLPPVPAPPPASSTTPKPAKTATSSATGAATAPVEDGGDGVRAGAVKAARNALAAARDAAKRAQGGTAPAAGTPSAGGPAKPVPAPQTGSTPRADMHYTSGGVRFDGPPVGGAPAGPPGGPTGSPAQAPQRPAAGLGGPRRVRLTVSRIDPWSIMKLAFLLSVAVAIMTVVAAAVFWLVVDSLGTFDEIQTFITQVIGQNSTVNIEDFVAFDRVVSVATLIAIVNIVLMTALATIMAILYNITAALVGGVHVTLTDD